MRYIVIILLFCMTSCKSKEKHAVVFQSDFGLGNNAVSAMYGVATEVDPTLQLYNLTHDVPCFDIWVASYLLSGVIEYWPKGTVFVSVVDPGVGTARFSVVAKTKSGHYIVTPDNGTLSFIMEKFGIAEMREIDEAVNRRKNSEQSYTFHGRDVYAYTGARLASGKISFEEVGRKLDLDPVLLEMSPAKISDQTIEGMIVLIDLPYGNVWTNIPRELIVSTGISVGDRVNVRILFKGQEMFARTLPYSETFGTVPEGEALVYINSAYNASIAINVGNFSNMYKISYGEGWSIQISKG